MKLDEWLTPYKDNPRMKTRMVLYEVSNGFMAVIDEDRENGTVVGKSIPEVLREAESLMVTRALERENDPRVWPENAGTKQEQSTPLLKGRWTNHKPPPYS